MGFPYVFVRLPRGKSLRHNGEKGYDELQVACHGEKLL